MDTKYIGLVLIGLNEIPENKGNSEYNENNDHNENNEYRVFNENKGTL